MRLYSLDARVGRRERRLYPWFDPPDPESPEEYYGWRWDPANREWVPTRTEPEKIQIEIQKPPKPAEPPRPAQPLDVPGWYWNGREKEWKEVPIPKQFKYTEADRPSKPDFVPRPEQGLVQEGWYWNGRTGRWDEAEMPVEIQYVERARPPEPPGWPSRDQPAEVLGWRYSFMYEVWEKIPMPRVPVEVRKQRPPAPVYPPGQYRPSEVLGWRYSDPDQDWVTMAMPIIEVDVTPERPPKPAIEPRPAGAERVYGWYWNKEVKEWLEVVLAKRVIETELPLTLPPGITEAKVRTVMSMTEQYEIFYANLKALGMTDTEAKRIGSAMVDGFWRMGKSGVQKMHAKEFQESIKDIAGIARDRVELIQVGAMVVVVGIVIGAMIGTILRRLTLPDQDYFRLTGGVSTYLIGPDNWEYSRCIGTSASGRRYYSACGGIGTTYVRHFRGHGVGQMDTIDFPGGFLEQGYKLPYYVKYLWSHWDLSYVGMLQSVGKDFYVLKEGKRFATVEGGVADIAPYDEWCPDFRFYL